MLSVPKKLYHAGIVIYNALQMIILVYNQYRMHLILVHDALNLRNLRLWSHHFRSGGHDVAYSLVKEFSLPFLHGASDITIGNKSDNVVVFIQ